eukprot:scaffold23532_cov31-Tisochrysis_lutea.AAC.2
MRHLRYLVVLFGGALLRAHSQPQVGPVKVPSEDARCSRHLQCVTDIAHYSIRGRGSQSQDRATRKGGTKGAECEIVGPEVMSLSCTTMSFIDDHPLEVPSNVAPLGDVKEAEPGGERFSSGIERTCSGCLVHSALSKELSDEAKAAQPAHLILHE